MEVFYTNRTRRVHSCEHSVRGVRAMSSRERLLEAAIEAIEQGMTAEELMTLMYAWNESFAGEEAQRRRAVRLAVLGSSVSRPDSG